MIQFILAFFIGFSAQASDKIGLIGNDAPATYELALESDTQLVAIELTTQFAVNCPGSLDLVSSLSYQGQAYVNFDSSTDQTLSNIMNSVSPSCSTEIFDYLNPTNLVTCLSIGYETGVVYLDLRHLQKDVSTLKVEFPGMLKVTEVRQLK